MGRDGEKGPGCLPGPRPRPRSSACPSPADGREGPPVAAVCRAREGRPRARGQGVHRVESGTRGTRGRGVTRGQRYSGAGDRVTRALPSCVANASPGKRAGGGSSRGWGYAGEEELPVGEGSRAACAALMEMKDALSRVWREFVEGSGGEGGGGAGGGGCEEQAGCHGLEASGTRGGCWQGQVPGRAHGRRRLSGSLMSLSEPQFPHL